MRLHWWPSAATSAFLMSGLEILTFVPYLLMRRRPVDTPPDILTPSPSLAYAGFVILVIGLAAEATAMWGISRRQQRIAPLTSHLSRLGITIYVATSVLLTLRLSLGSAVGVWVFQIPRIPEAVTFGLLGWASTGGGGSLQRWASIGLITVALIGCLSVVRILLGWATEEVWPWLPSVHVGLRAATWVLVGMWLRAAAMHSNVQPATE